MQPHLQKTGLVLRAMTYNIHSCVGMDKEVNPQRIAKVIGEAAPDVVALQEVDNGIPRTYQQDQAELLAEMLNMKAFFFPVVKEGHQEYGLAVLSRLESTDVQYDWLPGLYPGLKLNFQKRGCIRLTFETPAGSLLFFNTHLSLYRLERRLQIRALMGSNWLAGLPPQAAVIFCGDLNAGPLSPVYFRLARLLLDVQKGLRNPVKPRATFPTRLPMLRIDHMFVSHRFKIHAVRVPRTADTRLASDHLPIVADLELSNPAKPELAIDS